MLDTENPLPPTVRCGACELNQFEQSVCRRCKRPLRAASVQYIDRVVEVEKPVEVVRVPDGEVAFGKVLPTYAQLKALLYAEAMRRCNGNAGKAAALMGVGKTTAYRQKMATQRSAA